MNTLTKRADFGQYVEQFKQTGIGAEVGVQYGMFSKQIAQGWTGKILCVDLWPDRVIFEVAQEMLKAKRFTLHRNDSVHAAGQYEDESFDWVYIDADHHYDNVLADIRAWFPKVRKGGVIAGHDYCKYLDMEVIEAVNDFCSENGYTFKLTTDDELFDNVLFASWYFIK